MTPVAAFELLLLDFLECEFRPNSTSKASLRGEGCPSLIYSTLFFADVRLSLGLT